MRDSAALFTVRCCWCQAASMSARLTIDRDPVREKVTATVHCPHGSARSSSASGDMDMFDDDSLFVALALAEHADYHSCDCTHHLWWRFGRAWRQLGLSPPPFFGGTSR